MLSLLQICDYAPLETLSPSTGCSRLARAADDLGIQLELGTRGIAPEHLRRYLDFARPIGRDLGPVDAEHRRSRADPRKPRPSSCCRGRCPSTPNAASPWRWRPTSRCRSAQLVRIVEAVGLRSPRCLPRSRATASPASSCPPTSSPRTAAVREELARQRLRLHPAGRLGRIHPDRMPARRRAAGLRQHRQRPSDPAANNINQIVEHWLPWQDDAETTCALEDPMDTTQYQLSKE